jgi:hypothetical protein
VVGERGSASARNLRLRFTIKNAAMPTKRAPMTAPTVIPVVAPVLSCFSCVVAELISLGSEEQLAGVAGAV